MQYLRWSVGVRECIQSQGLRVSRWAFILSLPVRQRMRRRDHKVIRASSRMTHMRLVNAETASK